MIFNNQRYYDSNHTQADFTNSKPAERTPIVGIKDIGKTVIDGQNAGRFTQSLSAAMRDGVCRVEFQPIPGGQSGGGEVEEYGIEERKEIRQLAEINDISITSVHVPHQTVSNLSGMTRDGFSEQARYNGMEEIKKHIDFAADVANGGSIVVHTAEFPRSLAHGEHTKKEFWGYPGEEEEAVHHLIDPRTGKIMTVKENDEVWVPVQSDSNKEDNGRAPEGKKWLKDENGEFVIDEFWRTRYPHKFDSKTGRPLDDNDPDLKRFLVPVWKMDNEKNIETRKMSFKIYKEEQLVKHPKKTERELVKEFFKKTNDSEISNALGSAREFEQHYYKGLEQRTKILQAMSFWQKIEEKADPESLEDLKLKFRKQFGEMLPSGDPMRPTERLKEMLNEVTRQIAYGRETSVSGRTRARQVQDLVENAELLGDYALKKSFNTLGELGVYAWRESQSKDCKNPVYLTPENMIPEMGYGAHPQELINIVKGGRKKMVQRLTERQIADPAGKLGEDGRPAMVSNPDYISGMSKEKAEDLAKQHIRATLDTSHLGLWYKHFKSPKPGMNEKERIEAFQKWYMGQVKEMADAGIIGNVHVVDGFGRSHSHLAAGKGMLPVIEAVEYLKEKGITSISSEASGDLREIMTGTWESFGSPIYSFGRPGGASTTFGDVQNSYFGRANPPNYVVGEYRTSDDWSLWSGVPFE
ncbi:hypothetical protein HN587_07630 [Candidatus Woesearchaeota archaeon]|jgi:hypothetical protein|nr:hypothetical protein [Candidatus Woesearchaeota archaeon]